MTHKYISKKISKFKHLNKTLIAACITAFVFASPGYSAVSNTNNDIGKIGVFYVNGEQQYSPYSDNRDQPFPTHGTTTVYNQAKVTYMIPAHPTGPNIVLVPGYGLSSDIYMTTPDKREGWAQQFYKAGYSVYIISPPDRGESMPVDKINACKAGSIQNPICDPYYSKIGHATLESSWSTWGFGPKYGVPYKDSKFPSLPLKQNYVEQFGASFVPYLGTSDINMVDNVEMNKLSEDSITSLLKEIGPSVLLIHSAAGTAGYEVAEQNPSLVKAIVAIETTKCPKNLPSGVSPLADVPFLGVWGDHINERIGGGHPERLKSCQVMTESINRTQRAPAELISLPDKLNIHGNSHIMMEDTNNGQISHIIVDWLKDHSIK